MNRPTEIVCIVDRSGSMAPIAEDAIGGFNRFLEEQKRLPDPARLTLVLFDHEYQLVHAGLDIREVPPLTEKTYVPRGMTALLDAVGRTLDDLTARLAKTRQEKQPPRVIVAILTDGLENASTDYWSSRITRMIERQRDQQGWEFVFLGANQNSLATAAALSIDADDAFDFTADAPGVAYAFACLSDDIRRRRGSRKSLPPVRSQAGQ